MYDCWVEVKMQDYVIGVVYQDLEKFKCNFKEKVFKGDVKVMK